MKDANLRQEEDLRKARTEIYELECTKVLQKNKVIFSYFLEGQYLYETASSPWSVRDVIRIVETTTMRP